MTDQRARPGRRLAAAALIALIAWSHAPATAIVTQGSGGPDQQTLLKRQLEDLRARTNVLMTHLNGRDQLAMRGIVDAFMSALASDAEWKDLLKEIKLEAPPLIVSESMTDADFARSFRRGASSDLDPFGSRHVKITSSMFASLADESIVAARRMTAKQVGPFDELSNKDFVGALGAEVQAQTLAWTLGHELAHHKLGHFSPDRKGPATLAGKREEELSADRLSFGALNQGGFSLFLLKSYFDHTAGLEDMRARLGRVTPEERSDHPRWRTRAEALSEFMASRPAAPQSWIVFSRLDLAGGGRLMKETLMIPADPMMRIGMVARTNQPVSLGAVERGPGAGARVYERASGRVYTLTNGAGHFTGATLAMGQTGRMVGGPLTFYRDGFLGTAAVLDATGRTVALLREDFRAPENDVMKRRAGSASTRTAAQRLLNDRFERLQDAWLAWGKGLLTDAQHDARRADIKRGFDPKFDEVLGRGAAADLESGYNAFMLRLRYPGYDPRGTVDFAPPGQRFTVRLPGTPVEESILVGGVPMHLYQLETPTGAFAVSVLEASGAQPRRTARELDAVLDAVRDGMAAQIDAIPLRETRLQLDGNPGRALLMETKDGASRIESRVWLIAGSTQISLMVTYPATGARPPDLDTFLQSFRVR